MRANLPFGMGVVSFALNGDFDNPDPETLVEKVNQLEIPGKDKYIELLVMPTTKVQDIERIAKVIRKANYGITICAFRPGEDSYDMMDPDKGKVDLALKQTYHIMKCAKDAGADRVGGPFARNHPNLTIQDKDHPDLGKHIEYAFSKIAEKAEKMKLYMSLEMVNAFEIAGFNCLYTTLPIITKINSKYLLIHYDTAHATREEVDIISAATELYKSGKFGHAHISEAGRGSIGAGPVSDKLVPFLHNLASLGYGSQGEVVIVEVFHPKMYSAIKRVDKRDITMRSPTEQDQFAFDEAKSTFQHINLGYTTVCKNIAPK